MPAEPFIGFPSPPANPEGLTFVVKG